MTPEELIDRVVDLPTVSPAAVKLMSLLNKPDVQTKDVVDIVRYDTILSLKLLRVCNSALLSRGEPIASLEQAVQRLGYYELYRLVLALTVGKSLSRQLPGYAIDQKGLWRHSLATGLAAEMVQSVSKVVEVEASVAYTAGLVHDLGKLALDNALSPEVGAAVRLEVEQNGLSTLEAERKILQTDHSEIGAILLRRWNMPESIIEATANHHAPVLSPKPQLSAVVHVANCLAHEVGAGAGRDSHAVRVNEQAAVVLGIGPEKLALLMIDIYDSLARIEQLANVS